MQILPLQCTCERAAIPVRSSSSSSRTAQLAALHPGSDCNHPSSSNTCSGTARWPSWTFGTTRERMSSTAGGCCLHAAVCDAGSAHIALTPETAHKVYRLSTALRAVPLLRRPRGGQAPE